MYQLQLTDSISKVCFVLLQMSKTLFLIVEHPIKIFAFKLLECFVQLLIGLYDALPLILAFGSELLSL